MLMGSAGCDGTDVAGRPKYNDGRHIDSELNVNLLDETKDVTLNSGCFYKLEVKMIVSVSLRALANSVSNTERGP
jgi:hypothetical protein